MKKEFIYALDAASLNVFGIIRDSAPSAGMSRTFLTIVSKGLGSGGIDVVRYPAIIYVGYNYGCGLISVILAY